MIERFHGIDRHKRFSTISVVNRAGEEIRLIGMCLDLKTYIDTLGPEDAVILEASGGAFWWADQVEARGAQCYILNPYRFKIIKDSWNKTDKQDGVPRRPPFLWARDPPWQLPVQPCSEECMGWR
jgi:transposase